MDSSAQSALTEMQSVVLSAVFLAIQHALIIRGISSFMTFFMRPVPFLTSWALEFWMSLNPAEFLASAYVLATGDGALDEELGVVTRQGIKIYVYLWSSFFCWNIFGIWSWTWLLAKVVFHIAWPLALAVLLSSYSPTTKDLLLTLWENGLPFLIKASILLLRWSLQASFTLYDVAKASWRWTGWFIDIHPNDLKLPEHVYKPLDDRYIRLLKLSRKYPWGPMRFTLEPYHIKSCPSYQTISYYWGPPIKNRVIIVDKQRLYVTENAYNILRGRASFWTRRYVWIDTVCINQDDNEEKGKQIQMLRDIYRLSSRALVCLGEASNAFTAMLFMVHVYYKINYFQLSDEELKSVLRIGTHDPGWQALFELLNNPYWRRIWIVQEIAVATKVHLYYGGFIFSWDTFSKVMKSLQGQKVGSLFVVIAFDNPPKSLPIFGRDQVLLINIFREKLLAGEQLLLPDCLTKTTRAQATDIRDKIYGLLGLVSQDPARTILPDYTLSPVQVFTNTAINLIQQKDRFDPFWGLHSAGIGHERTVENLPSWVPEWTNHRLILSLWFEESDPRIPYNASRNFPGEVIVDSDSLTIQVTGYPIDAIKALGPAWHLPFDEPNFNIMDVGIKNRTMFNQAVAFAVDDFDKKYPGSDQTCFDAFWRTWMGDRQRGLKTRPASPEGGDLFKSAMLFFSIDPTLPSDVYGQQLQITYPFLKGMSDADVLKFVEGEERKSGLFSNSIGVFSGRKIATTNRGLYALTPPLAREGDIVFLLGGGQTPFLLRREGQKMRLVGECYVHGVMDGEMVDGRVPETLIIS